MDLKDKIALVTGGGTGIGKACSLALARQGVAVAVNYSRSEADARETVKEIVDVDLVRPRLRREALLDNPRAAELRDHVLALVIEDQSK